MKEGLLKLCRLMDGARPHMSTRGTNLAFWVFGSWLFNYAAIKNEKFNCRTGTAFRHWCTGTTSRCAGGPTATQRIDFCLHGDHQVHETKSRNRFVIQSQSAGSGRQGGRLPRSLAALRQPPGCPSDQADLPACFAGDGVLVGLELGVVVRELVIQH